MKKLIAVLLSLALIYAVGCGKSEPKTVSSVSGSEAEVLPSSAQSSSTAPQQPEVSSAASSAASSGDSSASAEKEEVLLTVYPFPESGEYKALGSTVKKLGGAEEGTAVRFTAAPGTEVALQHGMWYRDLAYFHSVDELCSVTAEAGTVYECVVPTEDETNPEYCLFAKKGNARAVWHTPIEGDEGGVEEKLVLQGITGQTLSETSNMIPLCLSAALAACQYGDEYRMSGETKTYWETVACAINIDPPENTGVPESDQPAVPEWIMLAYEGALYAGVPEPDCPDSGVVAYTPERYEKYLITPNFFENLEAGVEKIDPASDTVTVSVENKETNVKKTKIVCLRPLPEPDDGSPFGFVIDRVEDSSG